MRRERERVDLIHRCDSQPVNLMYRSGTQPLTTYCVIYAFRFSIDTHGKLFYLQTPVYVYYESLCPDSQAFITKQLYPAMKIFKDHVDLHLVPFGKSTVSLLILKFCFSLQDSNFIDLPPVSNTWI